MSTPTPAEYAALLASICGPRPKSTPTAVLGAAVPESTAETMRAQGWTVERTVDAGPMQASLLGLPDTSTSGTGGAARVPLHVVMNRRARRAAAAQARGTRRR